ncbi:quinone oxidoreductase family protein [Micromonospora chersina]|uniref:quinone oxidoreductase family protein n=1 Tax=Micromonospora chersina TaxID=47854 RepID=UPI003717554B
MQFDRYGGPEVLVAADVPVPEPGAGEVRIRAEAISVGYAQTQMRRDVFPAPMWRPVFPVVLGGDVVGRVTAIGDGVTGVRVGDRVGAFTLYGAYAEEVVVDAATLVGVPEALDAAEAAVLPGTGLIAGGVLRTALLRKGETVLVHAAAGGIGHLAVQLAKAAGAGLVVATAGSAKKRDFARSLGADVAVDYTRPDWAHEVRAATGGRGVDVVLESIGGNVVEQGVDLLAPGGRLVFFGSSAAELAVPAVPLMKLIGLRYVTGFALSAWRNSRPDEYRDVLEELTSHLLDGRLSSAVHARLPLTSAAQAHALVESRVHPGRVVLVPQPD